MSTDIGDIWITEEYRSCRAPMPHPEESYPIMLNVHVTLIYLLTKEKDSKGLIGIT